MKTQSSGVYSRVFSAFLKLSTVTILAAAFANCSKVNFANDKNVEGNTPYICDPFGGGGSSGGLKGRLHYFENQIITIRSG